MTVTVVGLADAEAYVKAADLLAGGKRQLAAFPATEAIVLAADVSQGVEGIREAANAGKRVVVLASGDPLLFGIGATLARELGRERVKIVPSVSSVQLAFARVAEPWHEATILSAHGRTLADILPAALAGAKLAILTDGNATPSAVAEALLEAGVANCRAVVCEDLGLPTERVTDTHLGALAGQDFGALNVLLVFREPADVRLQFGRPEADYESVRGQITRAEVRAVALSKLQLAHWGVLWDIGAGSGSVAIEAARLMPRGAVYAVERHPDQLACLRRNVARHHASNVHVVAGEAPEALAGLPAPQSVFVGGSGGRLAELLDVLPRPLVLNLAILEHVSLVLSRCPGAQVTEIAVSRSEGIADGQRLVAQNPVYVVAVP